MIIPEHPAQKLKQDESPVAADATVEAEDTKDEKPEAESTEAEAIVESACIRLDHVICMCM